MMHLFILTKLVKIKIQFFENIQIIFRAIYNKIALKLNFTLYEDTYPGIDKYIYFGAFERMSPQGFSKAYPVFPYCILG